MFWKHLERRQTLACMALLCVFTACAAGAQRGGPGVRASRAVEVGDGFVIFEGAYLPPPYAVAWARPAVVVNGLEVLPARQMQLGPRPFARSDEERAWPGRHLEHVANHLRGGGLIICRAGEPAVLASPGRAMTILDILIGDDSNEVKVQDLVAVKGVSMTADQWARLVERFEAPVELSQRLDHWKARQAELAFVEVETAAPSRAILSMMTLAGFALAVWALGTLLTCRPPLRLDGVDTRTPGPWNRQVVRLVVVIVVLSVHDLACTLFAHDLGSLWELNPLATPLLAHGPSVVAFKLSLTAGAAIVFLVARAHRLAQVGSWWMGVVYTILILRWTTYNSVFMA